MLKVNDIKERIRAYVTNRLENGNPKYTSDEIKESINLFVRFVYFNPGIKELEGLPRLLLPALQNILIERKEDVASLRTLSDTIEPFFKKVGISILKFNPDDILPLTLLPLIKKIDLNTALTIQKKVGDFPELTHENLTFYKDHEQYLYEICNSYLMRNKVHIAPFFLDFEILSITKDILTLLIYTVLKFKDKFNIIPEHAYESNYDENKMLFDFITFGNTSTEIKSQIIDAFILHHLIGKEEVQIESLKTFLDKYFYTDFTIGFVKRQISKLNERDRIEYSNIAKSSIRLSKGELSRIIDLISDYKDNEELFALYYKDILEKYGLQHHYDQILEEFTCFFEKNFDFDISEIYDGDESITENAILDGFITSLLKIINDNSIARSLVKDLLRLCEQSDFIVRLSASRVIGKISNPIYLQNYIRQVERYVYLDTQIVLYAICSDYISKAESENPYFNIVVELLNYKKIHTNIHLKFSKLYLSEVAFQIKLCLQLIPFENFTTEKLSNNVFYLFYQNLKGADLLFEEDSSLGEFMYNWLRLTEDDALDNNWEEIICSNISYLIKDLGIEIESFPYYEQKESACKLLENTIYKYALTPKSHPILVNDALMACHLSNRDIHKNEPFFLTWDKTFIQYRKEYKNAFSRYDLLSWHLYNPSKFLNNMELIEFRIDPKAITSEYLSILEGFGLQDKARTIFDNLNRLVDIKNISKDQRRKYIEVARQVFNENEFSYEITLPKEEFRNKVSISFESVLDNINQYFHSGRSKFSMDFYRQMMLNENYFRKVAETIKNQINNELSGNTFQEDYLDIITRLVEEYQKVITQHIK